MAAHNADTLQALVGMVTAPTAGELVTALCRRVGNGLSVPDRYLPYRLGLYCQRSNPSPHRVAISSRVGGQAGTEQGYPKVLKFDDSDALNIDGCVHFILAFDVGKAFHFLSS